MSREIVRTGQAQLPWKQLYRYVELCGNHHELQAFSVQILQGIREFVSFDRGLVYFLNGNKSIFNQYLLNMKDSWSNMYLDYYAKERLSSFSIENRFIREEPGKPYLRLIDWEQEPVSDFITNYIKVQGLKSTLAFVLFDLNGVPRTAFALDRMRSLPFTQKDMDLLRIVIPPLNNLHKNFYARPVGEEDFMDSIWEHAGLTSREIDVVGLLCQGISPGNISRALHIAPSTTYKHIAHIYEKMKVSTLQEMLVKILNSAETIKNQS